MRKCDVLIIALVLILVAGVGWGAYHWLAEYKVWAQKPLFMANEDTSEDMTCVSPDLPTLWHIARAYYPTKHTGQMVDAIRKLNPDLDPGRLQVGQIVRLP